MGTSETTVMVLAGLTIVVVSLLVNMRTDVVVVIGTGTWGGLTESVGLPASISVVVVRVW